MDDRCWAEVYLANLLPDDQKLSRDQERDDLPATARCSLR